MLGALRSEVLKDGGRDMLTLCVRLRFNDALRVEFEFVLEAAADDAGEVALRGGATDTKLAPVLGDWR